MWASAISASLFLSQRELNNKETRLYQRRRGGEWVPGCYRSPGVCWETTVSRNSSPTMYNKEKDAVSEREKCKKGHRQPCPLAGKGECRNHHSDSSLTPRRLRFPPSRGGSDPRVGIRMHLTVAGFQLNELFPCLKFRQCWLQRRFNQYCDPPAGK